MVNRFTLDSLCWQFPRRWLCSFQRWHCTPFVVYTLWVLEIASECSQTWSGADFITIIALLGMAAYGTDYWLSRSGGICPGVYVIHCSKARFSSISSKSKQLCNCALPQLIFFMASNVQLALYIPYPLEGNACGKSQALGLWSSSTLSRLAECIFPTFLGWW